MRYRSRLRRFIVATTAVTTMLSLGCLGLKPIIDALNGSTAQMAMTCTGGDMAANSSAGSQGSTITAPSQSKAGMRYDCGCQSCTAAAVVVPGAHAVRVAPVPAYSAAVAQLVGIATQPLLPPPERTL